MSRLEVLSGEAGDDGPFSAGTALPRRLPPGRHGIPANLVVEHQRLRLTAAMAEALAEHGYAAVTTGHVSERANVSTSTFYRHFGNIWDCLLAAYVSTADRLCAEIDAACTEADPRSDRFATGVEAALAFLSSEPALARLLCAQAPLEASAVSAARRILVSRLAAMMRRGPGGDEVGDRPSGLDERLIDGALAFVCGRICAGEAARLPEFAPELTAILECSRRGT